ncbi:MAG: terpene cyclase/mutase family protein [Pirellulales bacterium]|nr:terpene cyclase/mutase family protein [Pirellulales bacterium]
MPPSIGVPSARAGRRWRGAAGRALQALLGGLFSHRFTSFATSCLFHTLALLVAALITLAVRAPVANKSLTVHLTPESAELEGPQGDGPLLDIDVENLTGDALQAAPDTLLSVPGPDADDAAEAETPNSGELDLTAGAPAGRGQLVSRRGGGLEGRGADARGGLVAAGGGDGASEQAVARGLRWLAAHQQPDGGWDFDHTKGPCRGMCRNPGQSPSTTGATGVALLAFLGAGQTHLAGEYQDVVRQGLYYLGNHTLVTPQGGDLREGSMYGHALAAWALCEAFALSDDPALGQLAQQAVDFMVYAQDAGGGGWRYTPGQPGDLSVTGWHFMALKAAQLGYRQIPPQTLERATRFLDSVQGERGARYGYQDGSGTETMTAVGLLCRMFAGCRRDDPGLVAGCEYLSGLGPASDNMYFNYYATQVLFHHGGPRWQAWNAAMKPLLLQTQATEGHESGSWYFSGGKCEKGGRLFSTALAVMTLEVYYRYLPLYRTESVLGR